MASLACDCRSEVHVAAEMNRRQRITDSLRPPASRSAHRPSHSVSTLSLRPGAELQLRSPKRVGSLSFVPDVLRRNNQSESLSAHEDLENERNAKVFIDDLLHEIEKSCDQEDKKDTPIIAVMKGKYQRLTPKKRKQELLAVLTYYNIEDIIDQQSNQGQTALHLAVAAHDYSSAAILVAFGASVNVTDNQGRTPLDLLMSNPVGLETAVCFTSEHSSFTPQSPGSASASYKDRKTIIELLTSTGAVRGEAVEKLTKIETMTPFPCIPSLNNDSEKDEEKWLKWGYKLTSRYSNLRKEKEKLLLQEELSDEQISSLGSHQRELQVLKRAGSRILFLDGGGIRGLIQIEILSQLERKTGRRITELFDWIVGTSTGGIIALVLVYGKRTLSQLRQLYFKLKDEVFGRVRAGVATEVKKYEEILRKEFKTETGEDLHMDHVTYPRVMIAAVNKKHTNMELQFFNNCFGDNFHIRESDGKPWPVWEVARCTSAAPLLFGECNDFVDGGILANNPSVSGLTRIEQYYRKSVLKLPISLVVSIGSGLIPKKELGNINAQDILFVGARGWLDSTTHVRDRAMNLKTLLLNAISDTERTVENCRSRCIEQCVPFYRLNTALEIEVSSQETNPDTIINMMLQTTKDANQLTELKELITCLHALSNASRKALLKIQ